jgi:hypothetical protein
LAAADQHLTAALRSSDWQAPLIGLTPCVLRRAGAAGACAHDGLQPNRAQVIQSADVFGDAFGLIYSSDYNGGLYIMELNG